MRRPISICMIIMLFATFFMVFCTPNVEALDDDMNLDGYIWRNDGSPPNVAVTEFCVWVNYPAGGPNYYRYPDPTVPPFISWWDTSGVPDQFMWYSCVLPAEDKGTKWDNGANYWIWVDGSPWDELNGNCTSNGTGTLDDAPIPPLGSSDPHQIHWDIGGEENNEQQWDVRTQAPLDLQPTNVTIDGDSWDWWETNYGFYPTGQGIWLTITFNVTNFGLIGTAGTFNVTVWNCSATGEPLDYDIMVIYWTDQGPLDAYGQPSDKIVGLTFNWLSPDTRGNYYINISVDLGPGIEGSNITEGPNEGNNGIILQISVGSNLKPEDVKVNDQPYTWPEVVYVGPGEIIDIATNITNDAVPDVYYFNASLHNISYAGSPVIDATLFTLEWYQLSYTVPLSQGEYLEEDAAWTWEAPSTQGHYYVNISVDYFDNESESNENDNNYTIHFAVVPDLWIQNVTVDDILITDSGGNQVVDVVVGPFQTIDIMVNATDIGLSSTGIYDFNLTYTNCSANGDPGGNVSFYNSPAMGPILSGEVTLDINFDWTSPDFLGIFDFYVNITVDAGNNVSETNEANNYFILHIKFEAPDLTPDRIRIDDFQGSLLDQILGFAAIEGNGYTLEIDIPEGDIITIIFDFINVGGMDMVALGLGGTNVTMYNSTYPGGPPNATPFYETDPGNLILLNEFNQPGDQTSETGDTSTVSWYAPLLGATEEWKVWNITIQIDWGNKIPEIREDNNTFILIINVTKTPSTYLLAGEPKLDGVGNVRWYINRYTELNFTARGGVPPRYIWYNISKITSDGVIQYLTGWRNYTDEGGQNFTLGAAVVIWGEGTYLIYYYTYDSVPAYESIKVAAVIVDDTPPTTTLTIGDPKYPDPAVVYNITDDTLIYLDAVDGPPGDSYTFPDPQIDPGISNASGINDPSIPESGIFYQIWDSSPRTDWIEYNIGSPFSYSLLPGGPYSDGYYTIYYNSTDNLGQKESENFSTMNYEIIYLDNTGPDTFISVGDQNWSTNPVNVTSNTPFTLTAFEAIGSGADLFTLEYNIILNDGIGGESGWTGYSPGFNVLGHFPYPADGNYTIQFRCRDYLDNEGPVDSLDIYVDDTPPSTSYAFIGITHIGIYNWIRSNTLINLTAVDERVGVHNLTYRILNYTGDNITDWIETSYTAEFDLSGLPQTEGNFTIEYYGTDNLLNPETPKTLVVIVDDTPPETTIHTTDPSIDLTGTQPIWLNATREFYLTAEDLIGPPGEIPSGVDYIQYRIEGHTNWDDYTGIFTLASELGTITGPIHYNISFRAYDNLTNEEVVKTLWVFVPAEVAPPISDISLDIPQHRENPTDILNITSLTDINITAIDYGTGVVLPSGIDYIYYEVLTESGTSPGEYYLFDFDGLFPGLWPADDYYTIYFYAVDNAGNTEETRSRMIYLDNTGPTTFIQGGQTNWNQEQNAYEVDFSTFFTLTADDGIGSGVDMSTLEYRISVDLSIDPDGWTSWKTYEGPFNLTEEDHGHWSHTIEFRSDDNLGNPGDTYSLEIYIEGDITPPLPPILKCHVVGYDIVLEWTPSPSDDVAYYLLYRSETSNGFDFREEGIWVDTSEDSDNGKLPLRVTWNDTGAALPSAPSEYYYVIRAVDHRGNIGYTSNTAGKFTLEFKRGYNTFSVPLALFVPINGAEMLENSSFEDTTDTIYFYDTALQSWLGHPKFLPSNIDNFELVQGEAYMLFINEEEMIYTFTGSPGTAIRFIEGVGGGSESEDLTFRESLEVTVDKATDTVQLNWEELSNADGYAVFKSETRLGEGSLNDIENLDQSFVEEVDQGVKTWSEPLAGMDEAYYMVVAMDNSHEDNAQRASTYAVGVKKMSYTQGYSSFSLVLVPKEEKGAGWYAKEMFTWDADTIYYYDRHIGNWEGHPKFLPENINNPSIMDGEGYMIHVVDENGLEYHFIGL